MSVGRTAAFTLAIGNDRGTAIEVVSGPHRERW